MSDQSPKYRVVLQARTKPAGTYSYVITRTDLPHWAERSNDAYPNLEAASEAGRAALERLTDQRVSGK
jgi:hypothetical protein